MPTGLRSGVLEVRQQLAEGREKIRAAHERGLDGVQVCARLTALVDGAIARLYDEALADLSAPMADELRERVALVAHGGYGRRHMAPFSDIDLMMLHTGRADGPVVELARRITQDVCDAREQLGQSVRSTHEAIQLARQDPLICTSVLESRLVVGAAAVHDQFSNGLAKMVSRRATATCREFIASRKEERHQYGETVYLLEPNIKRSRGALRDLHLLRWLWFVKSGVAEPDRLHAMGVVSKFDYRRLRTARNFLLRVRNDLHFHAGTAADVLTRAQQVRVARQLQYLGTAGLHPAEQLMRDYFHHTNHVASLSHRLSELVEPTPTMTRVLEPMFGRSIQDDYRIGLREISATSRGTGKLESSLGEALRLADLARRYDKWIAQDTWYHIYRSSPNYSDQLTPPTIERFLQILELPGGLGELLRRLHELGVLEKVIPEFSHARCLLQFNQYHKYTVDEHCIRAVEEATRFADRDDTLGNVYRNCQHQRLLHLALLVHDLGKGCEGDHSDVGREIATRTAQRLGLSPVETNTLEFLVHRHLMMSHLAFRRDTNRPAVIEQFAEQVASPERLQLLYLLTCADLAAVGPDVLNNWKVELLTDVYRRTDQVLQAGGAIATAERRASRQADVWQHLSNDQWADSWFERQFNSLPEGYVLGRSAEEIAVMLTRLHELPPRGGRAWGVYTPRTDTIDFTAGVDQGSGRGVFSSMAGVFASHGIEILTAETAALADELLLECYTVRDSLNPGEPTPSRLEEISQQLVASIDSDVPPKMPTVWGERQRRDAAQLGQNTQEVRVDCDLAEDCTIIEVFAIDRTGLLYELARALHDLRLTIRLARIGTYSERVVDVFYVTERDGTKPHSDERIAEIRQRLMAVLTRGE